MAPTATASRTLNGERVTWLKLLPLWAIAIVTPMAATLFILGMHRETKHPTSASSDRVDAIEDDIKEIKTDIKELLQLCRSK